MFLYQQPQTDRKIKTMYGRSSERRLGRAVDHVSRGGFPVNPVVLTGIKRKLAEGIYRDDRDALIKDVKRDPGLFYHSAKHLRAIAPDLGNGINPEKQLRTLDDQQLQRLFHVTEREISAHRTRSMSKAQALRLQHSVVSSCAAEAMAKGVSIEPEVAYSSALFRQLGLNLVAWNYPDLYTRALRLQKNGKGTLEEELERSLGVSPQEIGLKLANEWNVDPEIRRALVPALNDEPRLWHAEEIPESHKMSLHELCELSELFSQASDPEYYPGANEAWSSVEQKVKSACGVEVSTAVAEKVKESLEAFEESSGQIFTPNFLTRTKPTDDWSTKGRVLFERNSYLQRCSPPVLERFAEVYRRLTDTKVSVEALKIVVESVIPEIGFVRGCLYLLDEKNLLLKPGLRFGDMPLHIYQTFKLFQNNLVTTSLDTTIPIKQVGLGVDGQRSERICGGLGSVKHPGVLYLEIDEEYFEDTGIEPVMHFHAIRQTLLDCLSPTASDAPQSGLT